MEHQIKVTDGTPKRLRPYRLPFFKHEALWQEVESMEQVGIIRLSHNACASPIVIVVKKDGTTRLYVNYQKLNKASTFDVYAVPRVDGKYISTRGIGKYQLRIYWEKTVFITLFGLYEFDTVPFVLQ
uniref:Uncharacterized protein n=1 Tax=Amphimedon queenslandica TaxID=400682 RepID=A0A1X7UTE8_AMPQE